MTGTNAPARAAGILSIATGIATVALLANHPGGDAHTFADVLKDEAGNRTMDAIVHGGFVVVLALQTICYATLSARIGRGAIAGLVFFAFGAAFLSASMVLDGLVTPALAVKYLAAPEKIDFAKSLFALVGTLIGLLMPMGLAFQSAAVAGWGVALVTSGISRRSMRPARVGGWTEPAYLHAEASDRPVRARALLSPFDSLIWERDRCVRLFDFRHSFELYVRPEARRYGYYVLPFLLGESLVARVDLKADQAGSRLKVLGAFAEPGSPGEQVAGELAAELRGLATWLGLDTVAVSPNGDLSADLAAAVSTAGYPSKRGVVK